MIPAYGGSKQYAPINLEGRGGQRAKIPIMHNKARFNIVDGLC